MKLFFLLIISLVLSTTRMPAQSSLPVPGKAQLAWHDMEFYLFVHFGPNTFTDREWGEGDEPAAVFDPTQLDCRQWARIAKQAGAKGIIITAKHHDGFCLWPSKYSTHTVRESKWKNGKGDVLKELSEACREYDLKFGVYISPWDRNHPDYGTEKYNDVFIEMIREIFSSYGPIWELWWDGANGEGPGGKKQVYDWRRFENTVREVSPSTLIFSDIGPDIRWCGNEKGIAGSTNWNYLDTTGFTRGLGAPPVDTLNQGNVNGKYWIPAECDVSIRPGWFYHPGQDSSVKTAQQLFDLYLKSVGRGANLLLNVPPDRRGLIHERDSASLVNFRKLVENNFKSNLALKGRAELHYKGAIYQGGKFMDGDEKSWDKLPEYDKGSFWLKFNPVQKINCIVLKEGIEEGQRIQSVQLSLVNGASDIRDIQLTTVGHKRIISFPADNISAVRIVIKEAKDIPKLTEVETYLLDEKLVED